MTITSVDEARRYLESKQIPVVDIKPITGGTSNYVWRIIHSAGSTSIMKHAEPHLSANPSTPFPLDRMGFEVNALKTIPQLTPYDGNVRLPKVFHYDEENHVLVLEDVGQKSLKDVYDDPQLNIQVVGESIGKWLAHLHKATTADDVQRDFNHVTAKRMYRWNYNNLSSVLERFGFDGALGERINSNYGSLLQTDDACVCHTDMWPGNVVFDPEDEQWPEVQRMAIIDWEVARQGNGVTDIGHFAGEAWFLDQIRGGRGLLGAFLEAYIKENDLSWEDRKRVAAQFGTHIVHWPTIYDWIDEQMTRQCVEYGQRVLEKVDEEDWRWFKGGYLGPVFDAF